MLKQKSFEILEKIQLYFKNPKGVIKDVVWLLCICFLLSFCLHPISGLSMYPTYDDGQTALCSRIVLNIDTGDVVIAWQSSKSEYVIKRVAAIPGDEILISTNGNMYVNGELYEYGEGDIYIEDYPYYDEFEEMEDGSLYLVLGEKEYFLVGDNHSDSLDSRYWGPFKKSDIKQKVICVW